MEVLVTFTRAILVGLEGWSPAEGTEKKMEDEEMGTAI